MSFLSYSSSPLLFVSSVGGVTLGGILLLLPWKVSSDQSFSSDHSLISRELRLDGDETNCKIIQSLDLKNLPEFINPQNYLSVSCEKETFHLLPIRWKGLFPKSIFWRGEQFDVGESFYIRSGELLTKDNDLDTEKENLFRFTISSTEFQRYKLFAKLIYLERDYSSWAIIRPTNFQQDIYLLLGDYEENVKKVTSESLPK